MDVRVDEVKNARRRELKAARAALPPEQRAEMDHQIATRVVALPEYDSADVILPYLSFGAEVDTREIIRDAWAKGKTVALPRCVEGTRLMRWYIVDSFEGLVVSSFGVEEPPADPSHEIDPAQIAHALVIVPGMEFDEAGYRLGYGGGFYDVFLSTFTGTSVGLCRSPFFSTGPLQHDEHDLPVDVVVTD